MVKASLFKSLSNRKLLGSVSIIAICACVLALSVASTLTSRDKTIESEWHQLKNTGHTLVEHTHRVLFGVDLIVSSLDEEISLSPARTAEEFQDYAGTREMFDRMRAMLLRSPDVDALAFIGADGITVNTTRGWGNKFNISKRQYFTALRDSPNLYLSISNPVKSKATGQEIIIFARRISGPDNTFWGIIMAVTTASRFEKIILANQEKNNVQISLFKTDRSSLVQSIDKNVLFQNTPAIWNRLEDELKGEQTTSFYTDETHHLGFGSVLSAEVVPNYPYFIVASKDLSLILREWQSLTILLLTFSIMVVGLIVWFGRYYLKRTEQLKEALKAEQTYSALQQKFVSLVSHEFRTPLAIIDGIAQRMSRRKDQMDSDEVTQRTDKLRNSVKRLVNLIDTTLYASRLDEYRIELKIQPCDLGGLLDEIIGRQREITPEYDFQFSNENLPNTVPGDPELLDHVFTNILSNAVKYSEPGTTVHVDALVDADDVHISVKDQGLGIPQDELPRMFKRFFRASTAAGISGTGIGLSVSKEFVEMHGGEITAESQEGVGSTFTVTLPLNGIEQSIT